MRELNMMRMICDTNYILNPADKACPKLEELARILLECMGNPQVKVLIFSEWERMLELAGGLLPTVADRVRHPHGKHHPGQRRQEIQTFREDPNCRVLLSTDAGGAGLNLQNASVVINCDQPWNPARLEQRIARAWRKDQTHAVTVLNLVSERTIEQRMLATLASKQALSDGVLDQRGDLSAIKMTGGRENFLQRLEALLPDAVAEKSEPRVERSSRGVASARAAPGPSAAVTDAPRAFCQRAAELLNGALISCEERFPSRGEASVLLMVVEREAERWREELRPLEAKYFSEATSSGEPPPAVSLEVLDRATADLLRRLAESGVVSPSLRASRVLYPPESGPSLPLSRRNKTAPGSPGNSTRAA